MTQAWYRVMSMLFGYISVGMIALVVVLAVRQYMADRALWMRVRRDLPQAGAVGYFKVQAGNKRLDLGREIRVPYEGTMGSSRQCDVRIPVRKVHLRSAFFWMEQDGLHMVALHRDGFLVDGTIVEPGDEAIMSNGAVLEVGEARLELRLYSGRRLRAMGDGPYVTGARKGLAQRGKGDGIGAPSRAEMRREKRKDARRERKSNQVRKTSLKRKSKGKQGGKKLER